MMNKVWGNRKRWILLLCLAIGMAGNVTAHAGAKQTGTFEGHPVFDNETSSVEISDGKGSTITRRGAVFAPAYDPRVGHMVSAGIEDQGATNTCWAFASIAAMESNLIKKGYENESVNLSENHLAYFFYNRVKDPVGYTDGDANINSGNIWYMNGGTLYGTALALSTWSGVVREAAGENNANGEYVPQALPAGDCYKGDYRVMNTYYYNYSVDAVKQAIMDYGAVASGIYMDKNYFNQENGAYNCTVKKANHAVAIVGWDDNYPVDSFKSNCKPVSKGAWIVKNSYGSRVGDDGYLYVSYEDKSLDEIIAFDMAPASQAYARNYQYDGSANPAMAWQLTGKGTFANVFKAKGSPQGCNEVLKAVSVEVLTTNVNYSLQIYTGVTGSKNPTKGKKVFSSPQTGVLTHAGYNQIVLDTPVTLTAGEKYSVVLTLDAGSGQLLQIGADATVVAGWIRFVAKVNSGQSFTSANGKWYDMGKIEDVRKIVGSSAQVSNFRIKAYTDNTSEKTTYKLNTKSLGISKGGSGKLSLKITPSAVKRAVTWTSSDKKVATVSSSGKVKAKTYGTATIKAQFVAGSKTKTLSCKVTVGPSKVKNFKVKGGKKKITVTWKKNSTASGYVIYYSKKENGKFKTLGTVTKSGTVRFSKGKLKKGTYYVKMCPYVSRNGKKLYGSYTAVKAVEVK